jgi:hypothetical protein
VLEGRLAAKGVVRGKRHLVVDVHSAAGNIDEDGSATVLFLRTFAATTRRESASNRRLVLINEDNLTRTKRVGRENIAAVWILSAVDRPSRSASLLCSLAGEAHGNRTGSAVGVAPDLELPSKSRVTSRSRYSCWTWAMLRWPRRWWSSRSSFCAGDKFWLRSDSTSML